MKKNTILIALCAIASAPIFAAQLTLQAELTPRVLNGESIYPGQISENNSIDIESGNNQLAVTVGQIVFEDGKRRKFDSQPLLLEFEAEEDTQLTLTYGKFRTIEDAKAFEKSPIVTLKNKTGNDVQFSLTQLNKGGLQGFRDYKREVADYNNVVNKQQATSNIANAPAATKTLKQSFSDLSREEQQEFMQWAMQNLK